MKAEGTKRDGRFNLCDECWRRTQDNLQQGTERRLVRWVGEELWNEFKATAATYDVTLGEFLAIAMQAAVIDDKIVSEAGCDCCIGVPLTHAENAEIFKRFAPHDDLGVAQLIRGWVLEKLAAQTAPDAAPLPASPGQAYLDSLNRRMATVGASPGLYVLTLPGLGLVRHYTALDLLQEVSMALYVGEDLIKERVLSRLPAWEAIELAELVYISNLIHGEDDLKPSEGGFWRFGLRCGSLDMVVSTADLLLHYCSLLHHHASLLSEQLIPHLPYACEAVRLARALATAEQVLAQAGDKEAHPGTVANPSPLLQRALALHADALLRAGEGMDISGLRGDVRPGRGDDERIGQRADVTVTEAKVAA